MACSHGLPVAATRRVVALHVVSMTTLREGSSPEGPRPKGLVERSGVEPGPKDTPDASCLLQCLYMADRCDRRCEGCAATSGVAAQARARYEPRTARQSVGDPDGNHGESNSTEGELS